MTVHTGLYQQCKDCARVCVHVCACYCVNRFLVFMCRAIKASTAVFIAANLVTLADRYRYVCGQLVAYTEITAELVTAHTQGRRKGISTHVAE